MTRDETLIKLSDIVRELVEPHQHVEIVWDDNGHGNKRMRRVWATTQPGLLDQLREVAHEGTKVSAGGPAPAGKPSSRPPGGFEALNTYVYITAEAARQAQAHGHGRTTAEENLAALVGLAPTLPETDLARLADEVRYWHGMASASTGWTERPYCPRVPCPACARFGSLRINVATRAGYCTNRDRDAYGWMLCSATWGPSDVEPLFAYVRAYLDRVSEHAQ